METMQLCLDKSAEARIVMFCRSQLHEHHLHMSADISVDVDSLAEDHNMTQMT